MNALPEKFNYLMLAGLGGSGEQHWQTLWCRMNPEIIMVRQKEWHSPKCSDWIDGLLEAIEENKNKPIVLIGHSLAATLILFAAAQTELNPVAGAFLTAPADSERKLFPPHVSGFEAIPRQPLPFPSMVVASENDEWCSIEKAKKMASWTQSKFVNIGKKGHITSADGVGLWENGHQLLEDFISLLD